MFDKNLKNPAAPSEAVGQSCLFRLSVPESELSHNSLNIHCDVPSLSRLAEKTSRFALKNNFSTDDTYHMNYTEFWSSLRDSKSIKTNIKNHSRKTDRFSTIFSNDFEVDRPTIENCFLVERSGTVFLLTKYVKALALDERWIFLSGSLLTRKNNASYLVRTVSPSHTEVRVFMVFVIKIRDN